MMDQGPDQGYIPEPAKSTFIADNPEEKEAAKMELEQTGLNLNYVDGGCYLGAYFGDQVGARGVGAAQGGDMGPRGLHLS